MKGRVERQRKPRAVADEGLEIGCQRENYKDGFDVRHGQRQEMEIATRIGEKGSVRCLLLRNRDAEVLDVYTIFFSWRFLGFSSWSPYHFFHAVQLHDNCLMQVFLLMCYGKAWSKALWAEYYLYRLTTLCFLLQSLLLTLKTFPLFLYSREHEPGRRLIPVCRTDWYLTTQCLLGNELDPPHAGKDLDLNTRLADKMMLLLTMFVKETKGAGRL